MSYKLFLAAAILAIGGTTASAQRSFGTFYAEYNPHQWHFTSSDVKDNNFHGISVGFSYFVPVMGNLGFDAGLKGQYFFSSEKENGIKFLTRMFSATVPVDVVYDLKISDGFAIDPFAGIYGRFNFSAKDIEETGNKRNTLDLFDEKEANRWGELCSEKQSMRYGFETLDRFQIGWQAGVNFRISDMMTIGAAYWMDFNELGKDIKLHGFNLRLGAIF